MTAVRMGIGAALLAMVATTRAAVAGTDVPPNIVLVLCDDLGQELLGHRGGTSHATPEFDRLAAEGVRLDTCLATPMCVPSRAMLLTGRYSFRNYTRWAQLDDREATIAARLRPLGYRTCLVGKWHLGNWQPDGDGRRGPARMGFERYLSAVLDAPSGGDATGNVYWRAAVVEDGRDRILAADRFIEDEHLDFIRGYLREADRRPFFLHYAPYLVHRPFVRVTGPVAGEDDGPQGRQGNFPGMVRRLDAVIGRLRAELRAAGIEEQTLLVVTSDNGTDNVAEARGLRSRWRGRDVAGGKYMVDELGTNVPCIVAWPGRAPAGRIVTDPVDFTDVLPTLLEAAGAEPPAGIDGTSFLPLVLGQAHPRARRFAFTWGTLDGTNRAYHDPAGHRGSILHAVRDERWRYLSDGRLYDAVVDPLLERPVALGDSPAADAARELLRRALVDLLASTPRAW